MSRITQQLNQDSETWRRRDVSDLSLVYLFLDGQHHAARKRTNEKEGVLWAYADGVERCPRQSMANVDNQRAALMLADDFVQPCAVLIVFAAGHSFDVVTMCLDSDGSGDFRIAHREHHVNSMLVAQHIGQRETARHMVHAHCGATVGVNSTAALAGAHSRFSFSSVLRVRRGSL